MALIPGSIRRDILSTWSRIPEIDSEIERRMARAFSRFEWTEALGWHPSVDFEEADGEFVLTAEIPGVRSEDMSVDVNDGVLTLRGEKKEEKQEESTDLHVYERRFGSFERRFALPRSAQGEKAKASFKDGLLTVRIPKNEGATGRKIQIESPE